MGRTQANADGSRTFAYPGVSFFIRVKGADLWLNLDSSRDEGFIDVIIDKGTPQVIPIAGHPQKIVLLTKAKKGEHLVEIIHRNETWHGAITFKSFEMSQGTFLPAPALPERRLLFLGDSSTCAEAVERQPIGKKNPRWWSARLSYGMVTAKQVQAQAHLVCIAGHGLTRAWNGKPDELTLPQFFELTLAEKNSSSQWNHHNYQPQVIVNSIGVTDFDEEIPAEENYIQRYIAFSEHLLTVYPNAQLIITEGAVINGKNKQVMQDYLRKVEKRMNSSRVQYIETSHQGGDNIDPHPTREQHQIIADEYTAAIKARMHW